MPDCTLCEARVPLVVESGQRFHKTSDNMLLACDATAMPGQALPGSPYPDTQLRDPNMTHIHHYTDRPSWKGRAKDCPYCKELATQWRSANAAQG